MSIQVFNTLTRKKEVFEPLEEGKVSMYICGPTVYDNCHIGHIMGPVIFDAVARWFEKRDYAVRFVNNITDIDDKIINRSLNTGEPWKDITIRYTQQYFDLLSALNVDTVTDHPRCSDHIGEMISYIEGLISEDKAYMAADGVYFDVVRHEGYGKLSGRKVEDMLSGARIETQEGLRNPVDFCLWKLAKDGEPSWESPWGAGRPGWHIECSVMSNSLLGDTFDIHGGGDDLKFPHHENEIAQGEAHGGCYAKKWMHNGLIQYEGRKIAKSDPRMKDPEFAKQFNALYLLGEYGADVIRFFILRGHYRKPFDFAPKELAAAKKAYRRLVTQVRSVIPVSEKQLSLAEISALPMPEKAAKAVETFFKQMDDDFNTGIALAQVFTLVSMAKKADDSEKKQLYLVVEQLLKTIGLDLIPAEEEKKEEAVVSTNTSSEGTTDGLMQIIIELRQQARANKNWEQSDLIRDSLAALNIKLIDSPDGCSWEQN